MVSEEIMRLLHKQDTLTDLYDLLVSDTSMLFSEKFNFVQEYFFNDTLLDISDFLNGIYPKNNDLVSVECYCKMLLASTSFASGYPRYQNPRTAPPPYPVPYGYNGYIDSRVVEVDEYWDASDHDDGKYFNNGYYKSAAKHMDNFTWGRRTSSKERTFVSGFTGNTGSAGSPNYAAIQLNWFCVDPSQRNRKVDCGCEKTVYYRGRYNVRLRSQVELPSCFLCGNKGSRAKAEDYAVMSLFDLDDNYEILAAGRGTVASENHKTYNADWFIELAEVAISLYFALNGDAITQILLNDLVGDISNLLTTNVFFRGTSDSHDETASLIQKNGTFTLQSNSPTFISLHSYGYTEVAGHTSWSSRAGIVSDFSLAVALEPFLEEGQEDKCCSDGVGAWFLASFPEAHVPDLTHIFNVGNFLFSHHLPYDETSFGVMWEETDCPVMGQVRESIPIDNNSTNDPIDISKYRIFSANGTLISDGKIDRYIASEKSFEIESPQFPGIYFVIFMTEEGEFMTSEKIIISSAEVNRKIKIYIDEK